MVAQADFESKMNHETSVVQKFYADARIFITGGTGFLGNLLIQKLIRDCPDASKLYLLVRSKKGKTPEQRLEEIFNDPVFDLMKTEQPQYADKIRLITGDLEQPSLGMNEDDIKMIHQEVNMIFHVGAIVRFDDKIRKAAKINVRATKYIANMARNISNLKVFIHVSTAYSHCPREEIDEKLYGVPMDPDRFLELTEQLNDDELEILTPKWVGEWPNTYTYTKALAEGMIEKYAKGFPVAIVRPSIIISTVRDPIAGWINNFYGPVGYSAAIATGIMRVARVIGSRKCELVPADYVINSMLVAAQSVAATFNNNLRTDTKDNIAFDELDNSNQIKVFNYISTNENSINWGEYTKRGMNISIKYVSINIIWHPFVIFVSNYYCFKILGFILEKIPGYLIDFILVAVGKKPMMSKIYKMLDKYCDAVSYFAIKQWKFNNDNIQALWKNTNATDKRIFEFSMRCLNWDTYFDSYGRGMRLYLVKDPLDTLPQTRRKARMFKIAHYTLITVFCCILAFLFYRIVTLVL